MISNLIDAHLQHRDELREDPAKADHFRNYVKGIALSIFAEAQSKVLKEFEENYQSHFIHTFKFCVDDETHKLIHEIFSKVFQMNVETRRSYLGKHEREKGTSSIPPYDAVDRCSYYLSWSGNNYHLCQRKTCDLFKCTHPTPLWDKACHGEGTDFTLISCDTKIHAHKAVLATSNYLNKVLKENFTSYKMDGVPGEVLQTYIEFIYTQSLSTKAQNDLKILLKCIPHAHQYKEPAFFKATLNWLNHTLCSKENVETKEFKRCIKTGLEYNIPEVITVCLHFLDYQAFIGRDISEYLIKTVNADNWDKLYPQAESFGSKKILHELSQIQKYNPHIPNKKRKKDPSSN